MAAHILKPCAMEYCPTQIKRRLLMCGWHWHMVPSMIKGRVFTALYDWQSAGKPVQAYALAVAEAKLAVARHEHRSAEEIAVLEAEVERFTAQPTDGVRA